MIIPIGHEQDTVRRRPWVTFGIMIACTAVLFMAAAGLLDGKVDRKTADRAVEYYFSHPYLNLDPPFSNLLDRSMGKLQVARMVAVLREQYPPPEDQERRAKEQAELDRLTGIAVEELNKIGSRRFGLVPADPTLLGWIAHMFMHAGFFHLLGNMLILYLAGPFIEDVWGRLVFGSFYFLSGLAAAAFFVLTDPDSMIPMIGASGAIAGVMGAFLIRYWNTRIKFFYLFFFICRGTFMAPAWAMLPIWFLEQFLMGISDEANGSGGSVAYWAHVGGFLFGVGFALLMKRYQVEENYLYPALQAKVETAVIRNPRVEQALAARERGDVQGAYRLLSEEFERNPGNRDASLALWTLSTELEKAREAAPVLLSLVEQELRAGEGELAARHWMELKKQVPHPRIDPDLLVRLGTALTQAGTPQEGMILFRQALLLGADRFPASVFLKIARISMEIDPGLSRGAAQIALNCRDLQAAEGEMVNRFLSAIP